MNDILSDTIDLPTETRFSYNLSTEGKSYGTELWINNNLHIENLGNESGFFTLAPNNFNHGNNNLAIKARIKSNSGSLADQFNNEFFLYEENYTLRVDNLPPHPIKTISFEKKDQGILVSWERYERANFLNYTFNFHNPKFPFEEFRDNNRDFSQKSDTSYLIENYVGQEFGASISVITEQGESFSDTLLIDQFNPEFYPLKIENEETIFSWSKSVFGDNFSNYTLQRQDKGGQFYHPFYHSPFYSTTSIQDTSLVINGLFIGEVTVKLNANSVYSLPFIEPATQEFNFIFGQDYPEITNIDENMYANDMGLIQIEAEKVNILRKETGQILNSFISNKSSVSNTQIASFKQSNYEIIIRNKQSPLNITHQIDLSEIVPSQSFIHAIALSWESSKLAILTDSLYLVDIDTNELISAIKPVGSSERLEISALGNMALVGEYLYALDNDNELYLFRNPLKYHETMFSNKNDEYFEIESSNISSVDIFNGTDRNSIENFRILQYRPSYHKYNPESNVIISKSSFNRLNIDFLNPSVLIISPSTKQYRSIGIESYSDKLFYVDDILILSTGTKMDLEIE
ncbi:MAG: hypothetical protein ABJE29_03675 [Balneola sp.]